MFLSYRSCSAGLSSSGGLAEASSTYPELTRSSTIAVAPARVSAGNAPRSRAAISSCVRVPSMATSAAHAKPSGSAISAATP